MNALKATENLRKHQKEAGALARVTYYLKDDPDFSEDVDILRELQQEAEEECKSLSDKLRAVDV